MIAIEELKQRINRYSREKFAFLPTPLHELPRFSRALGGPRIFIKRDDLTGLAFGGNKTRMFEFLLADARKKDADTIIGGALLQSNYSRQLAAACKVAGFEVHLVLRRMEKSKNVDIQGNLLLDLLAGANIHIMEGETEDQRQAIYHLAERLKREGRRVYVVRMASDDDLSLDAISYTACFCEIMEQCRQLEIRPDYLYASSYDSTQAGLEAGNRALGSPLKIIGISPEVRKEPPEIRIARYATQAAKKLNLKSIFTADEITNYTEYVGAGYGIVSKDGFKMLKMLAETEGIFLDPVYTSKAVAGLFDHINKGIVKSDDIVIFLHTGGTPALFAYNKELLSEDLLDSIDYGVK